MSLSLLNNVTNPKHLDLPTSKSFVISHRRRKRLFLARHVSDPEELTDEESELDLRNLGGGHGQRTEGYMVIFSVQAKVIILIHTIVGAE